MSIYGSLHAPDDWHAEDCGGWVSVGHHGGVSFKGACTCGLPDAPLVYQGSHVLPSSSDERGGSVDIAAIPGWITRNGSDDSEGDYQSPHPFLRFGVNGAKVVLTVHHVERIHRTLGEWLALPKQPEAPA